MIAEFINVQDDRWRALLTKASHDIYHLPDYVEFASRFENGFPTAFYGEIDGTTILIPLLLRELPSFLQVSPSFRDAITPYGYASPIIYPSIDAKNIHRLFRAFGDAAREKQIVSAFLRLHPLMLTPLNILKEYGNLVCHAQTIHIDLSLSKEEIWLQTRTSHRSEIRKLVEGGFHVVFDDWSLLPEFIQLYQINMKRVAASKFYFFPKDYFDDLRQTMGNKVHFCAVVSPSGQIACAGLFFAEDNIIQYHLSGTAEQYWKQAPTKLMLDFIRFWGKEQGFRFFHLGGGVNAENDSLLSFKSGFSKLKSNFYTYRMILGQNQYDNMVSLWKLQCNNVNVSSEYFPLYRSNC